MNLKDSERLVEKSKLIVEHAAIVCNYAQKPGLTRDKWLKEYIHFDDVHRVMEGNSGLAHDKDCQPITNIGRFRECFAPQYIPALEAIRGVSSAELEENKAAVQRAKTGYKKCLGRYLDRWFDADDKLKIEIYTTECDDILDDIDDVKAGFNAFVLDVYKIIGKTPYGTEVFATDYEKNLNVPVEAYINNITKKIIPAVNNLADCIMILDQDFVQAKSTLTGLQNNLDTILQTMNNIKKLLTEFKKTTKLLSLDSTKKSIEAADEKITAALEKLNEWVLIPCNLITTDSYLVCKCTGILSFYDNGQSYDDMCDGIAQATEDLIAFLEEECNKWYNGWAEQNVDPSDIYYTTEKEKGLRNSEQAIKKVKNLKNTTNVNPEIKSIDEARQGIHLEYWSHAYFEEGQSFAIGILTIFSIILGPAGYPLSMGLLFYQFTQEEDGDRLANPGDISSSVDIFSPFHSLEAIKAVTGLFDAYSAATSLFYTSNDTWTEEIRITFFTDDYAVIGSQKLSENGTKKGAPIFEYIEDFKYMESPKFNGIKWRLEEIEGEEYDSYVAAP